MTAIADPPRQRFAVLGVRVDAVDPEGTVARVASWIARGGREYVCVSNVHSVMETRRNPGLRAVLEGAGLTVPDGMPLVWMGRAQGHPDVRRVYGPDLTLLLCETAAREGWACFFHGGEEGTAARLARAMERRFPGLRVAGCGTPPFRALDVAEQEEEIRRINGARPDIVFVGLGCPKQELWMAARRSRLQAPVLVGVGAAFDFHTGRVRQAPRWMMSAGLEWLFRLSQEPRRLWRRYLFYNPLFVVLALAQLLGVSRGSDRG